MTRRALWLPAAFVALSACSAGAEPPDVRDAGDAGALPDIQGQDVPDIEVDARPEEAAFRLSVPSRAPADATLPILVHALDSAGAIDPAVDGFLTLTTDPPGALDATRVRLRHGVGALSTTWSGEAFTLSVEGGGDSLAVGPFEAAPTVVRGALDGDTTWGPNAHVVVDGELTVPDGATLSIAEGTWVAPGAGVNLLVDGRIDVAGAADSPVVFSGEGWGGVVMGEDGGSFAHVRLLGGGADESRPFGHSDSQAMLFAEEGAVALSDAALMDAPGKAMGARRGAWTIERTLVTRTDTGGEFEYAALTVDDSWFFDFPELDAEPRDDDNDGIYLFGDPDDEDPPPIVIRGTTFIGGADDGIDHNGSTVRVERSWIQGFDNECIAASSGGSMEVFDTVLVGCAQGLEAGYGAPTVVGEHLLVAGCDVGLRFGDNYTREYTGTLTVRDSVVFGHSEHAVWNWVFTNDAPAEGRVRVERSLVDRDEVDDGQGNVIAAPVLGGDLRLDDASPGAGIGESGENPGLLTPRRAALDAAGQ